MKLPENLSTYRFFSGIILLFCMISGYFYLFNQFWTHLDPGTFRHLSEFTGSRMRGHRGRQILVHRDFAAIVRRLNAYAIKNNLHLIITGSYRHPDKKITDAIVMPAVKSNHLAGHALDFNIVYGGKVFESEDMIRENFHLLPDTVKNFIADIRGDASLRWGGDFETQDPVHIDDAVNIHDPDKWERHFAECVTDYVNAVPKWRSWLKELLNWLKLG